VIFSAWAAWKFRGYVKVKVNITKIFAHKLRWSKKVLHGYYLHCDWWIFAQYYVRSKEVLKKSSTEKVQLCIKTFLGRRKFIFYFWHANRFNRSLETPSIKPYSWYFSRYFPDIIIWEFSHKDSHHQPQKGGKRTEYFPTVMQIGTTSGRAKVDLSRRYISHIGLQDLAFLWAFGHCMFHNFTAV